MIYDINDHPLPAFLIDETLTILSQSENAAKAFSIHSSFLDLVDFDSRDKAVRMLRPSQDEVELELVMNTVQSPYSLFQVFAKWSSGVGQIVCVRQDDRIEKLSTMLQKQRERLADTNFDLLDKKEELEAALMKIKKLSSPFLPISNNMGIIPLFGELEKELFLVNELNLLQILNNGKYERVILDFSGIGEIENSGVLPLLSFCSMLEVIGVSVVLCGLKPNHVLQLMKNDFELNQNFEVTGSLKDAVDYYLKQSFT
ncbi:STAS domain-containing protein [Anaerobacillus sp. 1_MG-2023]|uniref:STAS domain-containing protein n=1 Tax=Bacillales TaxID=1385 RepID=UPI0026E2059F|nr:STAS domain-containing protein [Anaerobacillus sp. 1_MG-2023]MDO6658347.1 STAS domain-containing protein [Anaerobacillus sp. 1_MG-2023]